MQEQHSFCLLPTVSHQKCNHIPLYSDLMHYYSGYKIIIIVINCPCQKDPFVYSNYEEFDLVRYRIIYNVL